MNTKLFLYNFKLKLITVRVASNKLKHILDFFHSELNGIYPTSEIEAMTAIAVYSVLGFSKTDMVLRAEENLNQSDLLKLYDCAKDLKNHVPLQYILKEAWFYNLKFYVNNNVLIPRPETEELVDVIIKENKTTHSFLDIGTGSGCIPVSIKKNSSSATVSACDISKAALQVAQKNAENHKTNIHFFEKDILNESIAGKFDVIISNPPYIKKEEAATLSKQVIEHEPHLALFTGEDDIVFYKKIIDLCKTSLNEKGHLYFELNPLTANSVKDYALNSNLFSSVELLKDMSGNVRFLRAEK
ncbi:MAG: peptide chain release factor N(5)-glutamine methyltransferase [Bacteroidetes bacterium]|nr:peptide chain release factor N(5)-glutamine methyltransferase [Bacteroidota bacterium]